MSVASVIGLALVANVASAAVSAAAATPIDPALLSTTDRRYYEAWGIAADDPDLHYEYGNRLMKFGDVEAARVCFYSALGLDPDHPATHQALGVLLLSENRDDEALEHFLGIIVTAASAATAGSFEASAHSAAGRTLGRLSRGDEALRHFEKAVELRGDRRDRFNLGLSLARHDRLAEATAQLAKAVELDPNFARARRALAKVLAEQERFEEAIPHYDALIARSRWDPVALFDLGVALEALGEPEKARATFERSLVAAKRHSRYREIEEQLEERLRKTAP